MASVASVCSGCTRATISLQSATHVVSALRADRDAARSQLLVLRSAFERLHTEFMGQINNCKRDADEIRNGVQELATNRSRMLQNVQGTLYSMQTALRSHDAPDFKCLAAKLQQELIVVEDDNEKLQKLLKQTSVKSRRLIKDNEEQEETIKRVKTELSAAQSERDKYAKFDEKYKIKQEQLHAKEKQVRELTRRCNHLEKKFAKLEEECVELRTKNKDLDRQLFVVRASSSRSQAQTAESTPGGQSSRPTVGPCTPPPQVPPTPTSDRSCDGDAPPDAKRVKVEAGQEVEIKPSVDEQQAAMDGYAAVQIFQLQQAVAEKDVIINDLMTQVQTTSAESQQVRRELLNMTEALEQEADQASRREAHVDTLTTDIAELRSELTVRDINFEKLHDCLRLSESALTTTRGQADQLKGRLNEAQSMICAKTGEVEMARSLIADARRANDLLQEQKESLVQTVDGLRKNLASLEDAFACKQRAMECVEAKLRTYEVQYFRQRDQGQGSSNEAFRPTQVGLYEQSQAQQSQSRPQPSYFLNGEYYYNHQ